MTLPRQISNVVLWFTYFKAVFNTLLSIIGLKQKSGFKVTVKKEDPNAPKPPPTVMGSFMQAMSSRLSMRRRKPATPEELQGLTVGEQSAAVVPPRPAKVEQLPVMMQQQPYIPQPEAPKKKPSVASRIANVFLPQNMGDMDGTLDALALVLLFFFCISTIAMGIYRWGGAEASALCDLYAWHSTIQHVGVQMHAAAALQHLHDVAGACPAALHPTRLTSAHSSKVPPAS